MSLLLAGYLPNRISRSVSSPAASDKAPEDTHRAHVGRASEKPLVAKIDPPRTPIVDNRRVASAKPPLGDLVVVKRAVDDVAPLSRLESKPDLGMNGNGDSGSRGVHDRTMREAPLSDSTVLQSKERRPKASSKRRMTMPETCWVPGCHGHIRVGRGGTAAGFCAKHWRAIPRLLRIELLLGRIRRARFEYFLAQAFVALGLPAPETNLAEPSEKR